MQKQQTPNGSSKLISYRNKIYFVYLFLIVFLILKSFSIFINQDKVYLWNTSFVKNIFMLDQSLIDTDMSHAHLSKSFFVNFKDGSIAGCHRSEAKETLLAAQERVLSYYRAFTAVV